MKTYNDIFSSIASKERLFLAWDTFKRDKRNKPDVAEFELKLEENVFKLHRELLNAAYRHGPYKKFWLRDPKLRRIHKATVKDRVLHHAIFNALNPVFEPTFIQNSFSCRIGKGTHKGVSEVARMLRKESLNNTRQCFALKCDVKKFFDSISHDALIQILERRITDSRARWLLREVIESFASAEPTLFERKGIPIGNLTSQLFANIYMNEFDQFMKHDLRVKWYARYTDDFVIVSRDTHYLKQLLSAIELFLKEKLHLGLHPEKITMRKYSRGFDFLGYVILPHHIAPRTKTKKRMLWKLKRRVREHKNGAVSEESLWASLQSYRGVLSHANGYLLDQRLVNQYWFWLKN